MIEFFLWGSLILGQILYWSFFKCQTAAVSHEYWKAYALRFRIARAASHRMRLSSQVNKQDKQDGFMRIFMILAIMATLASLLIVGNGSDIGPRHFR